MNCRQRPETLTRSGPSRRRPPARAVRPFPRGRGPGPARHADPRDWRRESPPETKDQRFPRGGRSEEELEIVARGRQLASGAPLRRPCARGMPRRAAARRARGRPRRRSIIAVAHRREAIARPGIPRGARDRDRVARPRGGRPTRRRRRASGVRADPGLPVTNSRSPGRAPERATASARPDEQNRHDRRPGARQVAAPERRAEWTHPRARPPRSVARTASRPLRRTAIERRKPTGRRPLRPDRRDSPPPLSSRSRRGAPREEIHALHERVGRQDVAAPREIDDGGVVADADPQGPDGRHPSPAPAGLAAIFAVS